MTLTSPTTTSPTTTSSNTTTSLATTAAKPPQNWAVPDGEPYLLKVENVTKRYGDHTVVDDLSLSVPPGRVTGFLGPNGSGKSTTLKIMLDLARADAVPQPGPRALTGLSCAGCRSTRSAGAGREVGEHVLTPWQGFGVMCLWTAALMLLANYLLRRRDA